MACSAFSVVLESPLSCSWAVGRLCPCLLTSKLFYSIFITPLPSPPPRFWARAVQTPVLFSKPLPPFPRSCRGGLHFNLSNLCLNKILSLLLPGLIDRHGSLPCCRWSGLFSTWISQGHLIFFPTLKTDSVHCLLFKLSCLEGKVPDPKLTLWSGAVVEQGAVLSSSIQTHAVFWHSKYNNSNSPPSPISFLFCWSTL